MKSSYKLIGSMWDGLPINSSAPRVVENSYAFLDPGSPRCLFDAAEVRRRVKLSELLSLESEEELSLLAARLGNCDTVAVAIDYRPRANGEVHRRFFEKRVSQALARFAREAGAAEIVLIEGQPLREEVA